MIPAIFAMWCMALPMGYLAGSVFAELHELDGSILPLVSALFPPLGMILAAVIIIQTEGRSSE